MLVKKTGKSRLVKNMQNQTKYETILDEIKEINNKYNLLGYQIMLLTDTLERLDNESDVGEITDEIFDMVLSTVRNTPYYTDEFTETVYTIVNEVLPDIEAEVGRNIDIEM